MMATRTGGRTAIVSRISVSRAPISVVIALSACGRFRVMSATCPPEPYSTSTGESGSAAPGSGGPKSSAFQRSVRVGLVATWSSFPGSLPCQVPSSASQRSARRPGQWVLFGRRADEDAVIDPLGLDELELALQVRTDEHEDDASVDAVVLQDAVGQHRAVAGAAPDHPVQA